MPPGEAASEAAKGVVFLGFTQYASSLLHELQAANPALNSEIAVVDFNPEVKKELDRRGIQAIYGDISHADTLHHARIHHGKVLVSTVPDYVLKGTSNARLLRHLAASAPDAQIIVTAETFKQARELYQQGAAFVFLPRLMSMRELCGVVMAALNGSVEEQRQAAFSELEARDEVLP